MKGRDAPAGTGATTPDRNKGKFFGGMLGQGWGKKCEMHLSLRRGNATERCTGAMTVKGMGKNSRKYPNLTQILIERTGWDRAGALRSGGGWGEAFVLSPCHLLTSARRRCQPVCIGFTVNPMAWLAACSFFPKKPTSGAVSTSESHRRSSQT